MGLAPHPTYPLSLGALPHEEGVRFLVWASKAQQLELVLLDQEGERVVPMNKRNNGYFEAIKEGISPGTRYYYRLDGKFDRPDPASRFQPDGVHRPSAVGGESFSWSDDHWHGLRLHEYVTYELHIGTFTQSGTFDSAIGRLDELAELGVTAIEIMPVSQFPGERNWGYDGVHPFAPQNSYGGPLGLKRFVDACHHRRLAVVMDVVYNHLGPEGNYLEDFGHYFTDKYRTPWGQALNFDGPHSDEVRRYFIENALYWIEEFHVDALRLDAVHAICDYSAYPFLQELGEAVRLQGKRLQRHVYTIAESNLNDSRMVQGVELGGLGLDAQWNDDFHHALRTTLLKDRSGYYEDFEGFEDLAKAFRDGFVVSGRHSPFRQRRYGNSASNVAPERLVVFAQNHDQVGNRMLGERLTELVSFEELKIAAATITLSPYQPFLFMGDEYAEKAPFLYFISHQDEGLVNAVRAGRKEEFVSFGWQEDPPDPQAPQTFERCKLDHRLKETGHHRVMFQLYHELLHLRRSISALYFPDRSRFEVTSDEDSRRLTIRSWSATDAVLILLSFHHERRTDELVFPPGEWTKVLDTSDAKWHGPGSTLPTEVTSTKSFCTTFQPYTAAVYLHRSHFIC